METPQNKLIQDSKEMKKIDTQLWIPTKQR
jgi:hypothetical protein